MTAFSSIVEDGFVLKILKYVPAVKDINAIINIWH